MEAPLEKDIPPLARLRITPELLERAGVERVTDQEARDKYGISGSGDMSGIAFPYFAPEALIRGERRRNYVRIRRDHPEIEDGKVRKKYVAPYGDRKHLYFPPTPELFADAAVPIILVEAEKSALALTAWCGRTGRKMLPIALGGCWGWRGKIGITTTASGERVPETGALPDLNVCREGRIVCVLLDANCATNPKVQAARADLVQQLRKQGARVKILDLPGGEDVNGPDDFLAVHGDEAIARLIDGWEDGEKLLDDIVAYYRDYVRMPEDAYPTLAVWVLHTHTFKAFSHTPYIKLSSPVAECGKTLVADLTELLVPEPVKTVSVTVAALSRVIEALSPTLIVDEMDRLKAGNPEVYSEIMAIINSGYKKGQYRLISVPSKEKGWDVKKLGTFCPKMLVGIGDLDPATMTRCIQINMERLRPGEHVNDPDERILEPQAAKLKERCARWAEQNISNLQEAQPHSPAGIRNRSREVSRPLFAIGDAAGERWAKQIRDAVSRIFQAQATEPSTDIRIELLCDIREAFGDAEKIASAELVKGLVSLEDRPWATWGRNEKGMTQAQLAMQLKHFRVYSKTIRLQSGRTAKGYMREDFARIWESYRPSSGTPDVTPSQPAKNAAETQSPGVTPDPNVTAKKCENPNDNAPCDGVTDGEQEGRVDDGKNADEQKEEYEEFVL